MNWHTKRTLNQVLEQIPQIEEVKQKPKKHKKQIIEHLQKTKQPQRLIEIATALNLNYHSIRRDIKELEAVGFVSKRERPGIFISDLDDSGKTQAHDSKPYACAYVLAPGYTDKL